MLRAASIFAILVLVFLVSAVTAHSQGLKNNYDSSETPVSMRRLQLEKQLDEAKYDIDINVFGIVRSNIKTAIKTPELTLMARNECKLCYTITWGIDAVKIKSTLAKYFNISINGDGPKKKYINIKKHSAKVGYSEPLYYHIMQYPIHLLVIWNNEKKLINITESFYTKEPNWRLYFKGSETYCVSGLSEEHLSKYQNITAKPVFNIFKSPGTGPIIEWKDIYGREEMGQRMQVSFSLGIDGRGAGSKYFVKGRYSEIHGEYYGAWAEFKEYKIDWDFKKILQFDTKNGDKSGWYIKRGDSWVNE